MDCGMRIADLGSPKSRGANLIDNSIVYAHKSKIQNLKSKAAKLAAQETLIVQPRGGSPQPD